MNDIIHNLLLRHADNLNNLDLIDGVEIYAKVCAHLMISTEYESVVNVYEEYYELALEIIRSIIPKSDICEQAYNDTFTVPHTIISCNDTTSIIYSDICKEASIRNDVFEFKIKGK